MRTHDLAGLFSFFSCAPAHFIRLLSSSPAWLSTHFHDYYGSTFIVSCECTLVQAVVPSQPLRLGRDAYEENAKGRSDIEVMHVDGDICGLYLS